MDRRTILERVASGELSPGEAERLLRGTEPAEGTGGPTERTDEPEIRAVRIVADFGAIIVEGDPNVTGAEVEGRHTATVEDGTLVVRADSDAVKPGVFSLERGQDTPRHRRLTIRLGGGAALRRELALRVRMNPALTLDARIDAGPISISDVTGPIRARSAAGPITIERFESPLDVAVNAGAIRAAGRLTSGESRLRSDAGAVRVELDRGSSVRIEAEASLGKVVLPNGEDGGERRFGSACEGQIGAGEGLLRLETAMGSIQVIAR